ncbi:uncharacterized protein [Drosophila virilis]|uniref:Uncharacterized protein, isoform A n=1 Tax=Drosophila virilis TaxID=7244 RepID=B4LK44_DROVI|nr:uncharacterized protein LOC6627195 [Drosophila virilis]EDW60633.1 uncharacterized protein Dvir_GJ20744, isoform A [Drosophila virilis]
MEMDVNRQTRHNANLMTISARCCANNNATTETIAATTTTTPTSPVASGCCGILSRLFCVSRHKATQSVAGTECSHSESLFMQRKALTTQPAVQRRRRTPQEIYFESRGKSCKKLLKFNGNSNKILLYPEEGWARTASSSYWTITPCWWQPNRCRIVECAGTQRQATKARMLPMEQQGSLLIAGHFRRPSITATGGAAAAPTTAATTAATTTGGGTTSAGGAAVGVNGRAQSKSKSQLAYNDEFKLYLTSNISMEDYNMGYCLTGFVERRCQLTNTFQMTHFAVIKRQWPPPSNLSSSSST